MLATMPRLEARARPLSVCRACGAQGEILYGEICVRRRRRAVPPLCARCAVVAITELSRTQATERRRRRVLAVLLGRRKRGPA